MTSERPFLDTNILVRYFMKDDPSQYEAARALIEGIADETDSPRIAASTVSEYVFVARGAIYRRTREEIADSVRAIVTGPFDVDDREVVAQANELYRTVHDDWDDCLVAAYAIERADGRVASFDRGLDRIPGLTRIEPSAQKRGETE